MSPVVPSSDEPTYALPPQLPLLAQALAPVAKMARQALRRSVQPSGQAFVMLDDLSRHMGGIERALQRVTPRLEGLMADVIRKPDACAIEVGRSAGRLEQVLSEFVDGYLDAQASHPDPDSAQARVLTIGVYRHHILSICRWLDDIVLSITDPAQAIQKRGIEPAAHVVLHVPIDLTSPPEMEQLGALVQRIQHQLEAGTSSSSKPQQVKAHKPGLLATVGALAFGAGLTEAVLRKSDG